MRLKKRDCINTKRFTVMPFTPHCVIVISLASLCCCFPGFIGRSAAQPANNPPVVKIAEPSDNAVYPPNTLVRYAITVSDKEDGETRFAEIPPERIFLEIRFSETTPPPLQTVPDDPVGLSQIKRSDCFTCHHFRTGFIGPSFADISARYARSNNAEDTLARSIRNGSQGRWGKAVMPAHKQIPEEDARHIAAWILTNGTNTTTDYRMGPEGAFRTTLPQSASDGYFILKATYTDAGVPGQPGQMLSGNDVVVIRSH